MNTIERSSLRETAWNFAKAGRYSRLNMKLMFGVDWDFALSDVLFRIQSCQTGQEFAKLFCDIATNGSSNCFWVRHHDAKSILQTTLVICKSTWEKYLQFDDHQAALDYLADALIVFRQNTMN